MMLLGLSDPPSPEAAAESGMKILGIVVGILLLLAAVRAMFGREREVPTDAGAAGHGAEWGGGLAGRGVEQPADQGVRGRPAPYLFGGDLFGAYHRSGRLAVLAALSVRLGEVQQVGGLALAGQPGDGGRVDGTGEAHGPPPLL